MSERAVADFVGQYAANPKAGVDTTPETARIVMSKRRLVVAGDERLTIPLDDVVDVVVGNAPADMRDLFDDTVTIGYESGGTVETVLVEAENETIDRFVTVLFRCLLNGTDGVVQHPARVGGRVTDAPVVPTKIAIAPERVRFKTPRENFDIDLSTVVGFDQVKRSPDGTTRPTLLVKHTDSGKTRTSLLAPDSSRKVNLLGRYLRIEYGQLRRSVADLSLTDAEKRLLVSLYATDGDIDFAQVLDGDAARATNVLNSLRKKDLVDEDEHGLSLTSSGQIVVTQRIEDVNV